MSSSISSLAESSHILHSNRLWYKVATLNWGYLGRVTTSTYAITDDSVSNLIGSFIEWVYAMQTALVFEPILSGWYNPGKDAPLGPWSSCGALVPWATIVVKMFTVTTQTPVHDGELSLFLLFLLDGLSGAYHSHKQ